MYTKFYNLKEKPFEITPNPHFLFLNENHKEALAHLTYAVRERKGFTVITGEVGTGKTTLIHSLLSSLDGNTRTAYLFNPKLGSTDFIYYICEDFGLKVEKRSKGKCLTQFHDFLLDCYARNENVVLIIDEAQTLDPESLEEVRLLTNLETPKSKLLQVILVGQPELKRILNRQEVRPLKQRVSLRFDIQPFNKKETTQYIAKRLKTAGAIDPHFFTARALNEIYRYSRGIPRLINIICDNALLAGYATGQKIIGDRIVRDVIRDLDGWGINKRPKFFSVLSITIFGLLCFAAALIWWGYGSFFDGKFEFTELIRTFKGIIERFYQEITEKVLKAF